MVCMLTNMGDEKVHTIWTLFTRSSDKKNATCKTCGKTLKTNYGSTSGLIRHLSQHPSVKLEYERKQGQLQPRQSKSDVSSEGHAKQMRIEDTYHWPSHHPKAKILTRNIAEWLADSMLPYSVVENEHFRKLIRSAQPLYSVPSRTTFSRNEIPNLYGTVKRKVSDEISQAIAQSKIQSVSFSCDLWTSRSDDAFLSLTCHFVNDFILRKYCLGCVSFPGSHTALAIGDKISEILKEWNILNNISANIPLFIVTDNARNIKLGSSLCKAPLIHLQCFAHTLQLALGDAQKSLMKEWVE